ncbi:NUDIX hydrolase [Sanguibacter sp. A247]|uniref:NUDIX hydrolase n=1 Tax=unclassified Sanguibacter TaxID=2645534 RepID=UPI003FD6DCFB
MEEHAAEGQGRPGVPAPPGGHALRIDRVAVRRSAVHTTSQLPVVDETSAGGLVVGLEDGTPCVAVIARRNRAGRLEWCLPKGHLEGVETPEEAAVREIHEETGILGRIVERIGSIDYWFSGDGRRVHKVVHHFLLEAIGGFLTVEGDPDHEAEDVAWVPLADLDAVLSYPNERRLAAEVRALLRRGSASHGTAP